MRTPAQIAGHPIHPMLVTIPIGLWVFSLVCDFIAMRSTTPDTWVAASLYAMIGGILGAVAAAIPGLIDLLFLRKTPVLSTAVKHMVLNLTIVVLYVINAWLRWGGSATGGTPLVLSLIAIAMLLVSGWLGGKMVYVAGVAVHADDTAPSPTARGVERDSARSTAKPGTSAVRGERAMASDSSGPAGMREERAPSARPVSGEGRRE
jgi:uncharacterized membrane protein